MHVCMYSSRNVSVFLKLCLNERSVHAHTYICTYQQETHPFWKMTNRFLQASTYPYISTYLACSEAKANTILCRTLDLDQRVVSSTPAWETKFGLDNATLWFVATERKDPTLLSWVGQLLKYFLHLAQNELA
jgi:hypothetical protein